MNIISGNDPLRLGECLDPGVVVLFTGVENHVDPEWEPYKRRLESASMRHNFRFETRPAPRPELVYTTVARRYNIGNLAVNAYAWITGEHGPTNSSASMFHLLELLIDVTDWSTGSIEVATCYDACFYGAEPMPSFSGPKGSTATDERRSTETRRKRTRKETEPDHENIAENLAEERELDDLRISQRDLLSQIGCAIAAYVAQFRQMPPLDEIMAQYSGKFLFDTRKSESMSAVVVNGNLDVVLPDYDEMVLPLNPLNKTIYLLFLMHPEGIVLKRMSDYEGELTEIYSLVKPGADDKAAAKSIADICYPGSTSLIQKISRIRRMVEIQLHFPRLVDHFSIRGVKGGAYRLECSANCRLPKALKH